MDLVTQQHMVDQLIPLLRERDFDAIFHRMTKDQNSDNCLLIKLEIKRRCSPCRRLIDMRDGWGDTCMPHEFGGITHFMPPDAISLFQSQCYLYHDRYTLGVYEYLTSWRKQPQGRVDSQPLPAPNPFLPYDVNAIRFASYYGRRQERMHFSSQVVIRLADGEKLFARTSDLSLGGARIAVSRLPSYQTGVQVELFFTGLARDHAHPILNEGVCYQILGEESRDDKYWLRLMRVGHHPEFDAFLKNFITHNKIRYRVSVDYLISAALIKGYEQFYLPRMTGMPLFFSVGDTPTLEAALRTENNQHLLEYWRDEKNRDTLSQLFSADRMKQLCPAPGTTTETVIYSFTHSVRSHLYFFSATAQELAQSGLTELFFHVGARRPSWRVFKFSLEACTLNEADIGNPQGLESSPLQDILLQERLAQLGYVGLLQEISLESQRDDFEQTEGIAHNANELQRFGHRQTLHPFDIETLHYIQLRKESRYIHKTAVAIRYHDQSLLGWTRDISAHGLQVELENPFEGKQDDVVTIALPRLQALAKGTDLQHLSYRLVSLNLTRTVLHLHIEGDSDRHTGRQFFSLLIESNRSKLKAVQEQRRYRGLARALRNIYSHHLFCSPIYLNKLKGITKLTSIGKSARPRHLDNLLRTCAEQKGQDNLYPLFQEELFNELLLNPLLTIEREDRPHEDEVYVAHVQANGDQPLFTSRLASSFANVAEKREFIEQALQQGAFYSVRVGISRTGRPDTNFIANELDYVAKFAIHKAAKLEEDLWSVIGVGELTDTTAATLLRLGITDPII
ncbi:PilZ domain-containing protein [Aeromonas cavernicola]|uniref:PilZ domain-containing protein n=1 Tax=Aeromonas cavernicola TaxID=1006623 RepID=A0A2H9U2E7_9GAMM|nr:PilZ domain-containing protein [Aeromonas cavernicola]PJG58246.1 PilZ domain-containing protein [Aeromonas cavernicola]